MTCNTFNWNHIAFTYSNLLQFKCQKSPFCLVLNCTWNTLLFETQRGPKVCIIYCVVWHVCINLAFFQTVMALRKVKGAVERVFDKNLNDLVRGIRAHKDDEVCTF